MNKLEEKEISSPHVLDASALLAGLAFSLEQKLITVPSVIEEVQKGKPSRQLEYLLEGGLETRSPGKDALEKVYSTVRSTGDENRLSSTDLELLALVVEIGGILVTDDYSIQNAAFALGIAYRPIKLEPIRRHIIWTYRCTGCGRTMEKYVEECLVCGSRVRTVPKKRT